MSKKCTFCSEEMKDIFKDEVYDIKGKILFIKDIPAVSCPSLDCQTEYYIADVLTKLNLITSQFEHSVGQSFSNNETMINYPSLFLKVK